MYLRLHHHGEEQQKNGEYTFLHLIFFLFFNLYFIVYASTALFNPGNEFAGSYMVGMRSVEFHIVQRIEFAVKGDAPSLGRIDVQSDYTLKRMLIIGIAGGTGSGKTTVVRKIVESLPAGEVVLLPQDSYYKDSSHVPVEERQNINFDHPDAFDWGLLSKHVSMLHEGESIEQPTYSYLTCTRQPETIHIEPRQVVIIEGILALCDKKLRSMMDLKIFVDADPDERLIRVIQRDVIERGRTAEAVMERYTRILKPMHLQFIEPSKRYADLIIPEGGNNRIAIDILTMYIKKHL